MDFIRRHFGASSSSASSSGQNQSSAVAFAASSSGGRHRQQQHPTAINCRPETQPIERECHFEKYSEEHLQQVRNYKQTHVIHCDVVHKPTCHVIYKTHHQIVPCEPVMIEGEPPCCPERHDGYRRILPAAELPSGHTEQSFAFAASASAGAEGRTTYVRGAQGESTPVQQQQDAYDDDRIPVYYDQQRGVYYTNRPVPNAQSKPVIYSTYDPVTRRVTPV
jgi:hypothetical protein